MSKNICRSIIFFLLLGVILLRINYIFRDKTECENIAGFTDEKPDSIDVVFLGSSQVIVGINPVQIWHDYGIVSYNCATSATNIPTMYYSAKLAIEKQHPKVLVADMSFICDEQKMLGTERIHAIWDNFSLGATKIEAIEDLVPRENRLEMYVPLYLFHSRWADLKEKDFKKINSDNSFKGSLTNLDYVHPQSVMYTDYPDSSMEINDVALSYLQKLIDLCKCNDTKLFLVAMPCPYLALDENYKMTLNSVEQLAIDQNVDFINAWKDEALWGLDYHTDFCDVAHVNFRGQKKITNLFGTLLSEKYQLPDKRGDNRYNSYTVEYERFEKFINDNCRYEHYKDGAIIDFGIETQCNFFCNGLWPSDGLYSWSGGEQNDAFFYLDDLDNVESVCLTLNIVDVNTTLVDKQHVSVYLNGNYCGELLIDRSNVGKNFDVVIPCNYVNYNSENHLTIKYDDVVGNVISKNNSIANVEDPLYGIAYKKIKISYIY